MEKSQQLNTHMGDRILFLQEFLRHPLQVGSVIPSSRFLEQRIVELAEIRTARTVVELGAGTGGTTKAILNALMPGARLLIIEINPHFCNSLKRCIRDPRLIVHHGSALELQEAIERYSLDAPEAIVSGIPFSTISRVSGLQILEAISSVLAPGGRFLAYQVSKQVDDLSRPLLGPAQVVLELRNIPPMRLYRWEKRNGSSAIASGSSV